MRRYDSMLIEAAGIDSGGRLDPAAIAQGVRQIAHDLHAMLKNAASSPVELMELERRIDALRVYTHGTPMIAIDRWLDNSRTAIRARVTAEQTPVKDIYAGVTRRHGCVTSC